MKTYPLAFALALAVLALSASPRVSAAPPLFHPPQSPAEKAMDEILRTSIAHPELFFIVLQNPGYDLSKTKEYEELFTAEFLTAWRRHERDFVERWCGGEYIPGKHCGYDINPIQCDGDIVRMTPPFFYRTAMGDDREAFISVVPTTNRTEVRSYYLRRNKGRWRLGGLYCEMDNPDPVPYQALIERFRQPKFESEKRLDDIFRLTRKDKDSIPFIFDLSWRDRAKDRRFSGLFTTAFLRSAKEKAKAILEHECYEGYFETGKAVADCEFIAGPIACDIRENDIWFERTTVEKGELAVIVYSDPDKDYSYPEGEYVPRFEYRMKKYYGGWKLDALSCGNWKTAVKVNFPEWP